MEKKLRVKIERKKVLILGVSIVLIMALFNMSFGQESTKSNVKTLQIGWSGSVTGWASIGGVLQWQGAQVARDIINEKGGITIKGQKYQIELVLEDDKSTTDGAVAAANRLVYDKKIKFMSGLALWLAAATKDICEPAKVLRTIIWTCNTPGEIGSDTPYTFLGNNATFEYALATMDYMRRSYPKVKNVVIVTPDDGEQPYVFPNITKWLEQRGISIVGDLIAYPNDMTDFSPIVQKLTATKADAIMQVNGWVNVGGALLKGLRERGDNRLFAYSMGTHGDEIMAISGKAAATNFFTAGVVVGAPGTSPLLVEVEKRLLDKYKQLSQMSLNAFNCVWSMANAIQKAQSLDTTVVKDTWEKMDTIDTLYGVGWMGGQKTYGIKHAVNHLCPMLLLDNGQAKFGAWMEVHTP
jgi:branched-chain amino acid transport system substrate-binding protein